MKPVILVVDDNEKLSNMLKDVLESWGYTALLAMDGHACLEIARSRHPDVIMLDIMLPGLSGYEVCSELKADTRTQSIAVIMFSALEDLESRIHGYRVGADNFLVKPINYNEVKAIIQKSLADKLYRDTLEKDLDVVVTLQSLSRLLTGQPADSKSLSMMYCNKLLESLNWEIAAADKARITLLFPSPVELAKRTGLSPEHIISLADNLRMGNWLKPVLRYLNTPADGREDLRSELADQNSLQVAELAQLVTRYAELFEEKNDRERSLFVLKQEAEANHYNQDILKRLEDILHAEQILESIN
ncbi:MAG: response regulator [Acidaminococcaceae bacterium]|nr:response regulator [Acidaminococcaceae bacterium]